MHAVEITSPGDVRAVSRADPQPGPGEVVVRVSLTGICGTDLHILDGHLPTATYPLVPGHEVTGRVESVGSDVTSPRPGDRVVVDPGLPCRQCARCRRGRLNLCENRRALGVSRDGGAAELVAVPAINCHHVDDRISDTEALLTEPLACVLHAFDLAPRVAGSDVLVYGAGTIGLLAVQVARSLGAHSVCVVDTEKDRLRHAHAVGADGAAATADGLDSVSSWDLVVDATGAPAAIADGLARVERGGTFLQIGVAPAGATVPMSPYQVFARELTILGSMTTSNTFPRALRLLANGGIDASVIVGQQFPLSEYAAAVEAARSGAVLKVAVAPRPSTPQQ